MGNSKYLDSLSKEEYRSLAETLYRKQNNRCFICGQEMDIDIQSFNIDHIQPLVMGGKDNVDNFALTHEHCNKSKGDTDLVVAQKLAKLDEIEAKTSPEPVSLKHILKEYNGSKYDFKYKIEDGLFLYSFSEIGEITIHRAEIFIDELSKEKTVYINVPIEYLYHDDTLNPRALNTSVKLLIKEFHKGNPQLQIALARYNNGQIKLFDGQHKTVAQIMLGVKRIPVRLFLDSDEERLMETNLNAGKKLRQIAFDKSIVRQLHNTLYAEKIKRYQIDHGLSENDYNFSEEELVGYFRGDKGNISTYIINSQKSIITHDPSNNLATYINFEGKGTKLPLSYSTFEKTFLARFINPKKILSTNIDYKVEEGLNPRTLEKEQLIELCNVIADEILINKYDTETGTYRLEAKIAMEQDKDISNEHIIACRMFKEEIMYNWVKLIETVIKQFFFISGKIIDEEGLFQQKFPEELWLQIKRFIKNLHNLPLWVDRSMAATIFGAKNNYNYWQVIFATGKTPAGIPILARPINILDMIKE